MAQFMESVTYSNKFATVENVSKIKKKIDTEIYICIRLFFALIMYQLNLA